MADKIQVRRGSSQEWLDTEEILSEGELGFAIDTEELKVGNGLDPWSALPVVGEGEPVNVSGKDIFMVSLVIQHPITEDDPHWGMGWDYYPSLNDGGYVLVNFYHGEWNEGESVVGPGLYRLLNNEFIPVHDAAELDGKFLWASEVIYEYNQDTGTYRGNGPLGAWVSWIEEASVLEYNANLKINGSSVAFLGPVSIGDREIIGTQTSMANVVYILASEIGSLEERVSTRNPSVTVIIDSIPEDMGTEDLGLLDGQRFFACEDNWMKYGGAGLYEIRDGYNYPLGGREVLEGRTIAAAKLVDQGGVHDGGLFEVTAEFERSNIRKIGSKATPGFPFGFESSAGARVDGPFDGSVAFFVPVNRPGTHRISEVALPVVTGEEGALVSVSVWSSDGEGKPESLIENLGFLDASSSGLASIEGSFTVSEGQFIRVQTSESFATKLVDPSSMPCIGLDGGGNPCAFFIDVAQFPSSEAENPVLNSAYLGDSATYKAPGLIFYPQI